MPKKYFFTINLLLKRDNNIKNAIDSITGDERFFRENIQLILIDPVGSPEITELCSQLNTKYPENIVFLDAVGMNPASCYNHARPFAVGSYISFIDNQCYYEKGTLKRAKEILHNERIPAFCMECVTIDPSGYDMVYAKDIDDGVVRLHETPEKLILREGCWFFLNSAARKLRFDPDIRFHSEQKYIIDAMCLTYSYVYSSECTFYTSTPCEFDGDRYSPQYSTDFYIRSLKDFIIPMLKDYAGSYLAQSAMMYLLGVKLALNAGESYKGIITGSRLSEFLSLCSEAFSYIDDSVILNRRILERCGLDAEYGYCFLKMKYNNPKLLPETDIAPPRQAIVYRYRTSPNRMEDISLSGEFACHSGDVFVMRSSDIRANIRTINFGDGGMYIDAELIGASQLSGGDVSVHAVFNGNKMNVIPSAVCTDRTLFGKVLFRRYAFRIYVPFSGGKSLDTLCFYFKTGRLSVRLPMCFEGIHSRLSEIIHSTCVIFGDRAITYDQKTKALAVRRATDSLAAIGETKILSEVMKNEGISGRLYYQRLRHMAKSMKNTDDIRKIILFYDEQGINSGGNLLFRYFTKHAAEKTVCYFVTAKDSPEQILLHDAGYENVLEKGSVKAKAAALAADIIIAADNDSYGGIGFNEADRLYLRDLASAQIISVKDRFLSTPHPSLDNRLRDNIRKVFVASEEEKNALLDPSLDFDEEMIHTDGNPLLDALADKREKLILISPGERRTFSIYDHSGTHRFTESIFCREYCSLLNDPKLISACREKGFHIALMMPAGTTKYESTFPQNDVISIYSCKEQNIRHLVSHAAVLVTDYSELQYQFAYLGKSVYYFYPPGLPSTSEPEGEGISRRGFGPVFFDSKKLIEALSSGMRNNFSTEEKYSARRSSFFVLNDRENCARICEAMEVMD